MKKTNHALILAFSADDVCRVTGLSQRQLAYWDKTGFFAPEFASPKERPFARVYSFRDVVGLRSTRPPARSPCAARLSSGRSVIVKALLL